MFLLWTKQLPWYRDWTPASIPPPAEDRSSPTSSPLPSHPSFVLPSFVWFYIFFPFSQGLLPILSWCSVSTSVSEGVFLRYLWRDMYSMSTFSTVILLLLKKAFFFSFLFSGTLHSGGFIFLFLPCLLHLFLSQLFVMPPQTTTLLTCIFSPFGMILFTTSCYNVMNFCP